jgi:hypothetical protein
MCVCACVCVHVCVCMCVCACVCVHVCVLCHPHPHPHPQPSPNTLTLTLTQVWKRRKSGQLASSAGRWYKVAIRAPKTDVWRHDVWLEYKATLKPQQLRSSATPAPAPAPATSYWLGWRGADPPHQPPIVPAAATVALPGAAQPVEALSVEALKAELSADGLEVTGKKADLQQRVREARTDLDAAQRAAAPTLLRISLPAAQVPGLSDQPVILPAYELAGPYALPNSQRQKRTAAPKGQQKWMSRQMSAALVEIAAGRTPVPLRRRQGTTMEEPPPGMDEAGEEEEEALEEGMEEEEHEEDMEDGDSEYE